MRQKIAFNGRLLLRKILTGLSLGAVAITFQACYGMPMDEVSLKGTVKDTNGGAIGGIQVSAYDEYDKTLTDSNGKYQLLVGDWEQTVLFQDIDGPDNGGEFKDLEVKWKPEDGPLDVVMELKE
jgi:hypothetical protein